jgi:hypothetical protein
VQRRIQPSFDIPVKMQPLETDGHNVVVTCDSSPDNKRIDKKSETLTSPLVTSGKTSIVKTNSPPSVLETLSLGEDKDCDGERHVELPPKENNTKEVALKNQTGVKKKIGNKTVQREKSEIVKGDNTVATKTKRRRVTLPMSSRSSPNVRSNNA